MNNDCIICGSSGDVFLCRKNGFDLYRCENCGLVRVIPPPSREQLESYYKDGYRQFRYSFRTPLTDPPRRKMGELKILERYCSSSSLLDVGAAYGHFMHNAKQYGWDVTGVEPQDEARILAQSRFRLKIHESLADAPDNKFSVVTLWHVIEHITTPYEFIGEIHKKLVRGGTFALSTPNLDSLSAKATGQSWGWLSPPDHVILYSPKTLSRLLEQAGFEVLHLETRRGPARNILLLVLQGIVYRLGLFNRVKSSVQHAVQEYQSARTVQKRINVFVVVEKITEAVTFLLTPVLAILWKLGLGDEVYVIARKKRDA